MPEDAFNEEVLMRSLYERMGEAYALHELILSSSGVPVDYRFLDANPAFFDILHLTRDAVVGKTALQLWPDLEPLWLSRYAPVALGTGDTVFEEYSKALGKWFKVRAFNAGPRRFAVLFQDVTERRRTEECLDEEEARFKAIINSMEDIVFTMDLEGRYTTFYGRALQKYGIREADYLGKTADEMDTPGNSSEHQKAVERALRGERSVHECDFFRLASEQGVAIQTVLSPMYRSGRIVGLVGVGRDMTEQRMNEKKLRSLLEEKTVLLQEVQHRVKNNLQIIISLIQLHMIAAPDLSCPVFMKTLQSRIYAIASVHDVLSASAVNDRVSLAALLRTLSGFCCTLTDIFPRLSDIRIEAEEETQLPMQTAIPVALVVHECILDAVQRAPAERGDLFLSISATALDKDRCRIAVIHPFQKTGVSKDTVGAMLLEGLVDQIRGKMTEVLEPQPQWVFDFPIAGAGKPIYPT